MKINKTTHCSIAFKLEYRLFIFAAVFHLEKAYSYFIFVIITIQFQPGILGPKYFLAIFRCRHTQTKKHKLKNQFGIKSQYLFLRIFKKNSRIRFCRIIFISQVVFKDHLNFKNYN